jgi:hypothetical protein
MHQQHERMLEMAAHKCRNLTQEIAETIIEIEVQSARAGIKMIDVGRPMDERNNALLEFTECSDVVLLLQRFHAESLVAHEVLERGSAVAFVTFMQDFEEALQERNERFLRLGFRSTPRFDRFVEILRSISIIDQPPDEKKN